MAINRSEKCSYQSRFGGGWISASQWLAENMCSRKARAESGELPPKFWHDSYWEKQLKLQLKHANDLLKKYKVEAIVEALKHPDAKKIYSLGLKSVIVPLIEKSQKKIDIVREPTKIDDVDITQKPRKPFSNKKNPLQILRELENG